MEKPQGMDELFDYDLYKAYLMSDAWDEKRTERLLFDDFQCQVCGNRNNVQVHHLVYPVHKNYGTESINDLITVCPSCHALLDKLRKGQQVEIRKRYLTKVRIECWIRFESHEKYLEEKKRLDDMIDANKGQLMVLVYLTEENRLSMRGQVNIRTYIDLKEMYGEENVTLQFKDC